MFEDFAGDFCDFWLVESDFVTVVTVKSRFLIRMCHGQVLEGMTISQPTLPCNLTHVILMEADGIYVFWEMCFCLLEKAGGPWDETSLICWRYNRQLVGGLEHLDYFSIS
jgi:hypothetical protein